MRRGIVNTMGQTGSQGKNHMYDEIFHMKKMGKEEEG